ncbi:hypothetical protein [Methylorubrum thiocyanatum]|uniref:hypothetical protein n=1 Tax=Methylorubrum thiocyanatum TaxID=47958 RepID=UPI0035C83F51
MDIGSRFNPVAAARARDLLGVTAELAKKLDKDQLYPVQALGYIGDGASHPLRTVKFCQYLVTEGFTLAQWKTLFPRATSLDDEIDRHAIQRFFDLRPKGGKLKLPAGTARIDKGIVTGGDQHVSIEGEGGYLTEIHFYEANGTLWQHGNATSKANGVWFVNDLMVRPKAVCAAAFNVWFSGNQPVYCHTMRNVQFCPNDGTNYFINVAITRKIARGLDWQNVVAFGRHFFLLSTDAFIFPGTDDGSVAGNTYNFNNCMTVGYNYGWTYEYVGFTSDNSHCHEEGQFYNAQSYSGVGLFKAVNGNYNYAPSDNWTFTCCGWQGTGPALQCQFLEHVRMRDTLLVNDKTTDAGRVSFFNLIDCASVILDANEIFSVEGTGITAVYVGGPKTRNIKLLNNDVANYAAWDQYLFVHANVPVRQVEERKTAFAGTGTYAQGKANVATEQISETRVAQLVSGDTFETWDVNAKGDVTWSRRCFVSVDVNGNATIFFPAGLFRFIRMIEATNMNNTNGVHSWVEVSQYNTGGVTVRFANGVYTAGQGAEVALRVTGW